MKGERREVMSLAWSQALTGTDWDQSSVWSSLQDERYQDSVRSG